MALFLWEQRMTWSPRGEEVSLLLGPALALLNNSSLTYRPLHELDITTRAPVKGMPDLEDNTRGLEGLVTTGQCLGQERRYFPRPRHIPVAS